MSRPRSVCRRGVAVLVCAALTLAGCARPLPEPPSMTDVVGKVPGYTLKDVPDLLDRAEMLYARQDLESVERAMETWRTAAAADRTRVEGLVGMARAGVWLTGRLKEPAEREGAAARAVHAAQWCSRVSEREPACEYWLGAALGVQARERPATAARALPLIEAAFKRARESGPEIEQAGPDRALALLYLRAPGWPAGPGDPDAALAHARSAVERSPDYPPNLLALGEALRATGDKPGSVEAYSKALMLAQAELSRGNRESEAWIGEARASLEAAGVDLASPAEGTR